MSTPVSAAQATWRRQAPARSERQRSEQQRGRRDTEQGKGKWWRVLCADRLCPERRAPEEDGEPQQERAAPGPHGPLLR
jgi:hypothetical protein